MCTVNELRCKEVINVCDGQRLGFIDDVEVDIMTGNVVSIIVPGQGKLLGIFGRESSYIIPWSKIQKIGNDTVLVSYSAPTQTDMPKKSFFNDFLK